MILGCNDTMCLTLLQKQIYIQVRVFFCFSKFWRARIQYTSSRDWILLCVRRLFLKFYAYNDVAKFSYHHFITSNLATSDITTLIPMLKLHYRPLTVCNIFQQDTTWYIPPLRFSSRWNMKQLQPIWWSSRSQPRWSNVRSKPWAQWLRSYLFPT